MVAPRSMRPSRQWGLPVSKTLFNYQPPVACKRAWQKRRGERKISQKDPCRKLSEREGVQKEKLFLCRVFRSKAHRSRHWLLTRNSINTGSVGQEESKLSPSRKVMHCGGVMQLFPLLSIAWLSSLRYTHAIDTKQESAMPLNEKGLTTSSWAIPRERGL